MGHWGLRRVQGELETRGRERLAASSTLVTLSPCPPCSPASLLPTPYLTELLLLPSGLGNVVALVTFLSSIKIS